MHSKIDRTNSRSLLLASAAATHNADQPAVLRQLLSNSKSAHEPDADGNTCIHLILMAALPEQPWTVQSLIEVIHSGALPTQMNHASLSAFDVACRAQAQHGSFRRDILLQALIETGSDIPDDRLLMPTELTTTYTSLHHAIICGDPQARADFHLRQALVNRLAFETHRPSIGPRSELYDSSVDRVLNTSPQWNAVDPNIAFRDAQLYLQRIIAARKQLKHMIEERISYETWTKVSRLVDAQQAQNSALLEFDWFQPVEPEDVFISQIDNLILRLEDIDSRSISMDAVDRLMWILEDAVPKAPRCNSGNITTAAAALEPPAQRPHITITLNERQMTSSDDQSSASPDSPRKESMVKTPTHFYVSEPDERLAKLPLLNMTCIDTVEQRTGIEPSDSPRKESMVKTPIHFYLCQLQTEDALPFTCTQRRQ